MFVEFLCGYNSPQDWDSCLAQYAFDDSLAQAGRIVIDVEQILLLVVVKFVEAISIRKCAESAELLGLEAILQFEGHGHLRHAGNYSIRATTLL